MESQSDCGNGPVTNMKRVATIDDQEIQSLDEKRAKETRNVEMKRRIKDIPALEERRLLALERHIKRKRRRRPYVKKIRNFNKTEQQLSETLAAPHGKMPDDHGAFDLKDKGIQVCGGEGIKGCSQNEIEGTRMEVSVKYGVKPNWLQTPNELSDSFEMSSTKMDAEEYKQQTVQFDKFIEYVVLDNVKPDIVNKVEDEFESLIEVKQLNVEGECQIEKDEKTCIEVKGEELNENVTQVKKVNTSNSEDAGHVNEEDLKKEKEKFKDEEYFCAHLERAENNENKIVDIGGVKAEQTFNTLSARIKESKPEDPELEASKTSQLIKHEKENDFDLVVDDFEDDKDDEEDDDDDFFMPRKLFFFNISQFKKEELSA